MISSKPNSSATKLFLAAVMAVGAVGTTGAAFAVEPGADVTVDVRPRQSIDPRLDRPMDREAASRPAQRFNDMDAAIRAVRNAASTSEVVDAYAGGTALDRDNVALQQAYVRRLVELNAPPMAEPVARKLVAVNPDSPLAWAVIAFSEARRGSMPEGLADISIAARKTPDDPFVQRTAGELLAWYDNAPQRPTLAAGVASDLDAVRRDLAGRAAYVEAYGKAGEFYKNPPQRPDASADADQRGAQRGPQDRAYDSVDGRPDAPAATQRPDDADDNYPRETYVREYEAPSTVYVDHYVPEYVPEYVPSYYVPSYYSGVNVSVGFDPFCLFLGGDWGYCYGGGWHHHWDGYGGYGYGRGYGRDYGRYGYDRGYGRSSGYYGSGGSHRNYYGGSNYGGARYSGGGRGSYAGNYGGSRYSGSSRGSYASNYGGGSSGSRFSGSSRGGASYGYSGSAGRSSGSARSFSSARHGSAGGSSSFGSAARQHSSSYSGGSSYAGRASMRSSGASHASSRGSTYSGSSYHSSSSAGHSSGSHGSSSGGHSGSSSHSSGVGGRH